MVGCTCLWYRLITGCLVQVGAWLMQFFMVQVDYKLMHSLYLLVQVYSGISHSDSVTLVPSLYFYSSVAGHGKDKLL
jgi:hypothetical protein